VHTHSISKNASDKNQNYDEDLEDSHASSEGRDSLQIREGEIPAPIAIKVMPITKCSHVHRKHYAKVILPPMLQSIFRICAPAVTGSMAEVKMLRSALTRTAFFTQWACARHVILLIITR
jgi:hypothetical protein